MGVQYPDAALHPVATGTAAEIVSQHQREEDLKLYSGWFCPFVQRAWIVLEEKKIPYQYIEINPYHKSPDFLALNPRGLVPTLGCPYGTSFDGSKKTRPLYESTIICEYLHDTFPNQGPNLFPTDSYEKARTRIWIDHVSSKIIPAWHKLLQHTPSSPYTLDAARDEFKKHVKSWIREAAPTQEGPWWLGKEFSMADIVLAPWVGRHWALVHFGKDPQIPDPGQGGEDEEVWTRWRKWVEAVEGRESVKKLLSEREQYLPIYQRYAEDKAQSEMAKATREGRAPP